MSKIRTLGVSALSLALVSGAAMADDAVYGKFPVTVKGYSGSKTSSTGYTGQIARHLLHDTLKKLAYKGNGSPNAALKAKMMRYFKGSKEGHAIRTAWCYWSQHHNRSLRLVRFNSRTNPKRAHRKRRRGVGARCD